MVKPHESWKNSIYSVFTLNNIFLHSTVIWKRCWIFVTMPLKGLCKSSFLVAQIQVVEFEPERKIFIALIFISFRLCELGLAGRHQSCNFFNTLLDDDTLVWYFLPFWEKWLSMENCRCDSSLFLCFTILTFIFPYNFTRLSWRYATHGRWRVCQNKNLVLPAKRNEYMSSCSQIFICKITETCLKPFKKTVSWFWRFRDGKIVSNFF